MHLITPITPRLPPQHHRGRCPACTGCACPAAQWAPHWLPVHTSICYHVHAHMIICAAATLPCACRCRCHGEPALHRSRSDAESPVGFILSPEVTPEAALPQAETEWDSSSNTTGQEPRVANRSTVSCKRHLLQHLMHWMSKVVLTETSLTADTCTDRLGRECTTSFAVAPAAPGTLPCTDHPLTS